MAGEADAQGEEDRESKRKTILATIFLHNKDALWSFSEKRECLSRSFALSIGI